MTTSIDRMITSDLAALHSDVHRDLPAASAAVRDAGIYRDGLAGAQARRDSLAEERRVQLALMPLAIAQVFAHRVGRAAAGAAAVLCSIALVMLVADPLLMRLVTWFVPGLGVNIGLCMMVAATAILVTYVVATWVAELWFTRRMRDSIETHSDVYRDLDQLARGPIEVAQKLVRRVDGWSLGLGLAGFASLTTVFGYLLVMTGAFQPLALVLSTTSLFAERAAAGNLGPVIYGLVLVAVLAFLLGRSCEREQRIGEAPPLMQRVSHWSTLAFGALVGMTMMFATMRMLTHLQLRLPSSEHRYLLAIGTELALLAVSGWSVLWWRRREQKRLGD
ncbi:hypothetical protein BH11MYX3_BH11MYX3_48420 [soil metagenome]